jgi:methyltransferase family protein
MQSYFPEFENNPRSFRLYPHYPRSKTETESRALTTDIQGKCSVCGKEVRFIGWTESFRESGFCQVCGSTNRQRQIAFMLRRSLQIVEEQPWPVSLPIYNTEGTGSLHDQLALMAGYQCSEYFGDGHQPGQVIKGVRHEDLLNLSFADNEFEYVLSSDVLEHVPDPYRAHKEIWRVLRNGGRHIFTVPFYPYRYFDEIRSHQREGKLVHELAPQYHADPLRPEGVLTYTIFSLEMLLKVSAIGFLVHTYVLYEPEYGIIGWNNVVFEAIKQELPL